MERESPCVGAGAGFELREHQGLLPPESPGQ